MSRGYYVPCAPFLYFVPDSGGPPQQAQAPPQQAQATSAMDVQLQRPPSSGPTTSATAAAPFQYFLHEQARSLVALQELQHEVGALLEFRELVMDTFPNLRSKLHTTPACTSPAQAPPAGWGPGVRVRRKLGKERVELAAEDSSAESSSKPAGKQQPKSSEGASSTSGSTVQDSGFSTETKEHLSSVLSPKLAPTCAPPPAAPPSESMDELWNLLDVIQRKGSRLRDEVEELHTKLQRDTQERQQQQQCRRLRVRGGGGEARADVAPDEWLAEARAAQPDDDWTPDVRSWGDEDESSPRHAPNHVMEVQRLRHERDVLLDKVTEMEAETLQSRARVSQLQLELRQVAGVRRELEAQLSAAVRSRLQQQARSEPPTPVRHVISQVGRASCFQPVARSASSPSPRRAVPLTADPAPHTRNRESRIPRPHQQPIQPLGRLDGVLSDPSLVRRSLAGLRPDSHKIAAILKENSPLELRRHLLISVVENQALQVQLQTASSSKEDLAGELERVREENDDLRFQLEEKSIELEGTRARVRVLEKHQQRLKSEPVKVAEEALLNSSSTESAHDGSSPVRSIQQPPEPPKRHHTRSTTIKGKKPSRIPLPPPKAFSAPSSKVPARAPPARTSPASSLQNTRLSRESISSRSNKEAAKESPSKLFPSRKNATSSRPTSSPSSRNKTAGVLELDATKVAMVQVALEPSFPVDSLNEFPAMCEHSELSPWRSSPCEYFDSMNSCVPPPPEQLWQRHSDLTQHSLLRPPDSLDTVAWTPAPAEATKNAPTGLWRVSEHIETILRQISRQTKCDFNN